MEIVGKRSMIDNSSRHVFGMAHVQLPILVPHKSQRLRLLQERAVQPFDEIIASKGLNSFWPETISRDSRRKREGSSTAAVRLLETVFHCCQRVVSVPACQTTSRGTERQNSLGCLFGSFAPISDYHSRSHSTPHTSNQAWRKP